MASDYVLGTHQSELERLRFHTTTTIKKSW